MRWLLKAPDYGDMIRVKAGEFYHYGVYVSDVEVIQFGLAPTQRRMMKDSDIEVISSDIDTFLAGGFLEVADFDKKEKKSNRSPSEAVEFARERLGMRGYNILYNNCEHFATECVMGKRHCDQTESVRALFRSMAIADVYVTRVPDNCEIRDVIPEQRQEYISSLVNDADKTESYASWRLLEYALNKSLGLKMADTVFTLNKTGKWCAKGCEFSVAHSGGAVAVAISKMPIGIDIEPVPSAIKICELEGALTEEEREAFARLGDEDRENYLITAFTAKQAIFKKKNGTFFNPAEIKSNSGEVVSRTLTVGGKSYVVSVATSTPDRIKFYEEIAPKSIL